MNAKNASYSINEISNLVEKEGYKISPAGELIPPTDTNNSVTTTKITASTSSTTSSTTSTTSLASTAKRAIITVTSQQNEQKNGKSNDFLMFGVCGLGALIVIGIIRKKAKSNKQ